MSTERRRIAVAGLDVDIVRKDIKNLHLGVYPPDGHVRVAAPLAVSDEAVRLAVIDKLAWIKRQRAKFIEQPRQSRREMVNGESHYYLGRRYRLRIHECDGPGRVTIRRQGFLDLYVRPGASAERREAVLLSWRRRQLRETASPLLEKWQTALGLAPVNWGIKKMKTRWGGCNVRARRIWLNLELSKKTIACLEYIVVHELAHLLEHNHTARFAELMDRFLPQWRSRREELNASVLGH